jgi:hypothetical protein
LFKIFCEEIKKCFGQVLRLDGGFLNSSRGIEKVRRVLKGY